MSKIEVGGGGDRIRTRDPQLAKLVLYQLSYAPANRVESQMKGGADYLRRDRHRALVTITACSDGGPEWIRTTYLALIRRVL